MVALVVNGVHTCPDGAVTQFRWRGPYLKVLFTAAVCSFRQNPLTAQVLGGQMEFA